MKRIIALLAVLSGLVSCSQRQPAPGTYVCSTDASTKEIRIIHGDCVGFEMKDSTGETICSTGAFEKKGRYPHYKYRYKEDGSNLTITADFSDGGIDAHIAGYAIWWGNTLHIETTKPQHFLLAL